MRHSHRTLMNLIADSYAMFLTFGRDDYLFVVCGFFFLFVKNNRLQLQRVYVYKLDSESPA